MSFSQNDIRDIVVRARLGDQVAMATIGDVRRSASEGSPVAKDALKAIQVYIKKNPEKGIAKSASTFSPFGAETRKTVESLKDLVIPADSDGDRLARVCVHIVSIPILDPEACIAAVVILANGSNLYGDRIRRIAAAITDPSLRTVFLASALGRKSEKLPTHAIPFAQAGFIVHRARRIQLVRLPHTAISVFSPRAAWEHGE